MKRLKTMKKNNQFKIYQHAYFDSHQKPVTAVIVERQSDGEYFRNIETFPARDLDTLARLCWSVYRRMLFEDFNAREVVLNCNILGRVVARRGKGGEIIEEQTRNVNEDFFDRLAAGGDA